MAEQPGDDIKLRAAFLLPSLVIIVALAIVAGLVPSLIYPVIWTMPVVTLAAFGGIFLTRRRRRRNRD
ncbi:hypothetical protein [Arthrobacter monumenti]